MEKDKPALPPVIKIVYENPKLDRLLDTATQMLDMNKIIMPMMGLFLALSFFVVLYKLVPV